MRILVTGGAGFIGANFLTRFVPQYPGYEFINVDALTYAANLKSLIPIENSPNYKFEKVDLCEFERLCEVFERHSPNVVVHFAAESHVDRSISGPRAFIRTNVEGTFNLLEACRAYWGDPPQGIYHHVSTDEVYGSLGDEGFFSESSPYSPSSPYSASKAASDHIARAYARTFGLKVRITNCSNNYGPLQFPEKLVPLMILNALERKPLPVYGNGLNVRDWLFVNDHCDAIWAVLHRAQDGATYNIGGRNEVRNIDVVYSICRLVASEIGVCARELLDLVTFVEDRPGHDYRYAIDASKIEKDLGWKPKDTFESGLKTTVKWYLQNTAWVDEVRSGEYRHWISQNYKNRGA